MTSSTPSAAPTQPSRRDERGTVLIFVVGVLVLLALAATAYLSTARVDRTTTKQNEFNTQVDLLLEACRESVIATLLEDESLDVAATTFEPFDYALPVNATISTTADDWLAPRVPVVFDPASPFSPTNPGMWGSVTGPFITGAFESPTGQIVPVVRKVYVTPPGPTILSRTSLIPHGIIAAGRMQPVFTYDQDALTAGLQAASNQDLTTTDFASTVAASGHLLWAGDADGDGIADSLPVKLPVGKINGITYYAYFRVIDNASAINVNTAMSRDFDFSGTQNQTLAVPATDKELHMYGFFTTGVGIAETLRDYTPPTLPATPVNLGANFQALLEYRAHNNAPAGILGSAGMPIDDNGAVRNDFTWFSWGDAFDHQLGYRLDNAGFARAGERFRAYGLGNAAALSYKFLLRDSLGTSELETVLQASLLNDSAGALPANPYSADQAQLATGWFSRWFDYRLEDVQIPPYDPADGVEAATFRARRPLLTATSNTRNLLPQGTLASTVLPFNTAGTPKTNPNTASVAELFRAFYMVMIDPKTAATGTGNTGTIYPPGLIDTEYSTGTNDPFKGMHFDDGTQNAITTDEHPARVFRSPIRSTPTAGAYSGHVRIEAAQMAKLRAAIAAVNADSMRRQSQPSHDTGDGASPDVVVPQDLPITGKQGTSDVSLTVRIFGVSRQPYITEVFGHLDHTTVEPSVGTANPNGYIAIELYNPHDFPIDISQCRLATTMRHGPTSTVAPWNAAPLTPVFPKMVMEDLAVDPAGWNVGRESITFLLDDGDATAPRYVDGDGDGLWDIDPVGVKSNLDDPSAYAHPLIIPARGYLVMENYDPSGSADPSAATYRPGSVEGGVLQVPTGSVGTIRPANLPPVNAAYVRNLHLLFNREFVLLRPLNAVMANRVSITPPPLTLAGASQAVKTLVYIAPQLKNTSARDFFMPMDSYDLSGLMLDVEKTLVLPGMQDFLAWHYSRSTPSLIDSDADALLDRWSPGWQFVYPGRYDAMKSDVLTTAGTYSYHARQQGTNQTVPFSVGAAVPDPWDTNLPAPDTGTAPAPAPSFGEPSSGALAQDKVFTIQLYHKDWPGPNAPSGATNNLYPFGQFARLGDLMQVPFIGAYTIIETGETDPERVIECNPITMDAAMAEDTDADDDPNLNDNAWDSREQVGRFAPLRPMDSAGTPYLASDPDGASAAAAYSDYVNPDPDGSDVLYRYAFGRRLLDYFSVQSPHADGIPNVVASRYQFWNTLPTSTATPIATPEDVSNSGAAANTSAELTEPVRGLININTAPWKVLAMVPWVPYQDELTYDPNSPTGTGLSVGADGINDNDNFAHAFVLWRDGYVAGATNVAPRGPITSLMDLYKVPAFIQLQSTCLMGEPVPTGSAATGREPDDREGDISPFNPTISPVPGTAGSTRADASTVDAIPPTDGIRYDFEEQYLLLNRVSNLITTRSDTYTVYILLQGYRNTGTANPELVVERRAAMIVDRSRYTTTNGNVTATKVPTN